MNTNYATVNCCGIIMNVIKKYNLKGLCHEIRFLTIAFFLYIHYTVYPSFHGYNAIILRKVSNLDRIDLIQNLEAHAL